jgi:hypothetical protein
VEITGFPTFVCHNPVTLGFLLGASKVLPDRRVTVQKHRAIKEKTLKSLLDHANISKEKFLAKV